MILNLDGPVNPDMVDKLIQVINQSDEQIVIYFCSEGGDIFSEQIMIKLLSDYKERIILIGYGCLYSAAFYIFFKAECPTMLMPYTIGMAHQAVNVFNLNERGLPKTKQDKFHIESLKAQYKEGIDFGKNLGFTDEELKTIIDGDDLFLPYKRMLQLWKNRV